MSFRSNLKNSLVLLLFALLSCLHLQAQNTVVFNGEKQLIINDCAFIRDSTGLMTLVGAMQKFTDQSDAKSALNLDHTDDAIWLKCTLKNESEDSNLVISIENALVDSVDFYVITGGQLQQPHADQTEVHGRIMFREVLQQHVYLPENYDERKFKSPYPGFYIKCGTNEVAEIYIRIRNTELMLLPVALSTERASYEDTDKRDEVFGIFIGVILVMIFYNLFVFISTRDFSYFYYVLYILFIGLAQITLSGHTLSMFFASNPMWFKYCIVVFPALSGVFAVIFIRHFLQTKKSEPGLDKGLLVILGLYALCGVTRLADMHHFSSRLMDFTGIPGGILVYIVAIRIYRKGLKSAIYFLIAWTIFIVGIILFILRNFNILPFNTFTNYTLPFGAAIEVALLSFALADRINTLQRQKREKEKEILEAALENERLIREQNVMLEKKVAERTSDLASTNDQLSNALTDLKETQSQLVEKEKMASLGQLTAGIAHEINNPINFVTSNISPLRRDLKMVLNLYNRVEQLCLTAEHPDEKAKIIRQLKKDIDYDYLQEEVAHLLKGIDDGAQRTSEIVKGLRIFAHADEDTLNSANLEVCINSALIILNNSMNGIKVKQQFEGDSVIECFAGKLNQVFLNILSNAIYAVRARYGDQPGGEINISSYTANNYLYLKFSDNGIGMNEETRRRVFEPFFTTKPVGEGTGLGMSIVFKTVELHKGKINVESEQGIGSTFEIQLLKTH